MNALVHSITKNKARLRFGFVLSTTRNGTGSEPFSRIFQKGTISASPPKSLERFEAASQAVIDWDVDALKSYYAPECVVVGPDGESTPFMEYWVRLGMLNPRFSHMIRSFQ